ncbi:MAG: T9SS type A sorting domain-containing protein [Candidatus Cloacimonetes bacterium]|nr:T9SS type A sorting domain-containing protein [Candidatus Cloacimonadota bacterium]
MHNKFYITLIIFLLLFLSLNAEEPVIIRENTNFAYESNSVTLDDGVVSIWADTKTSVWNIYIQKVDAAGNMLWNNGEPLLLDEKINTFWGAKKIVVTSDNCVIAMWITWTGVNNRMYAQKISSSGEILWSQNNELIVDNIEIRDSYLIANNIGGAYIFYDNYEDYDIIGFNLDADAIDLWSANLDPLFTDVSLRDIVSDNYGGSIINYIELSGDENLMAARIDFDREILWDQVVAVSLPSYYSPEITSVGTNDFVIYWRSGESVIGQRVDLSGNIYWGAAGIEINNEAVYVNSRTMLTGSDDSFFMGYLVQAPNPNEYTFKIQKTDLNGNSLWTLTVLDDIYYPLFDLQTKVDQGCYIMLYFGSDIIVQNIDLNGNKLWEDDGITLGSEYSSVWTQDGIQINEVNNNVFSTWQLMKEGRSHLRYQCLDQSGNILLPEDGVDIRSGMLSGIDNFQIVGNDDSSYYLWEDYRYSEKRIFAQRVSAEGEVYFDEFGIALTDTSFSYQNDFVAKPLPEGGIVAVWSELKENEEFLRVRWQILHEDGTVFSANGVDITNDVVDNQTKPKIEIVEGNIIVIWLENGQIKAQKLVNYSPVWGSNGSLLIENGDTGFANLTGSYIYFEYLDEYYFNRIDESGNISADWPFPGVELPEFTPHIKTWNEFNDDLVYTWRESYSGLEDYGFQILTSDGEYVFPGYGLNLLTDVDFYNYKFLFDGYINLFHQAESDYNILMDRYDLQGETIWNGTTCFIENYNSFNRLGSIKMGNKFLVIWCTTIEDSHCTYMMQIIGEDGIPLPSNLTGEEYEVFSSHRDYQVAATTDTDAAILFERGYTVGSDSEFFSSGLVTYLININDLPIDQNEIVMSSQYNLTNHPNPFNPTTEISFNLTTEYTSLRNASAWQAENTEISIYNIKGQKVKQLFKGQLPTGKHSFVWNGKDGNDKPVSSGVYLYKLNVNGKIKSTRKCLLMK